MSFILFTKYYLLQAILARKLDVPELHSLMNKVEKEAITADNAHMRLQCRQVGTLSHTHTQACTHTHNTHIYICDYSVDRLVHFHTHTHTSMHTHTTHTYIYVITVSTG